MYNDSFPSIYFFRLFCSLKKFMRATFKSKSLLLHGATVLPSKWERNKKFGAAPTMVVWVVKFSNGRFNIHRKLFYFVNRHSTAPSHHKLIIIFRSQSVSELNWSTNVNSKKYTPKLKIVFESHILSFFWQRGLFPKYNNFLYS